MKKLTYLLIWLFFLPACARKDSHKAIREMVIEIAAGYAEGQLNDPVRKQEGSRIVLTGTGNKKYIIDPSRLFIGKIDNDEKDDAVITLIPFEGENQVESEHLLIISSGKEMHLLRSIESDMKILGLSDGIITAELPTHPRTSPLFHCSECREIVRYKLEKGDLVKAL